MSLSRSTVVPNPAHVQALLTKHAALKERIEREQRHPSSSDFLLRQLKLEKLRLKEEIEDQKKASSG